MDTLTVTFKSSSSSGIYTVMLLGEPVNKLLCTCPGYENQRACKHINAILDGDPDITEPAATAGYHEALEAIRDSPVRTAYEILINGILGIDEQIRQLKIDQRTAKKMFYRMLSEGIHG